MKAAIVGGGVVGAALALALARRGVEVVLLEAEPDLALAASGTNSGILHTGFDSTPGELETRMILRSAELRPALMEALGVPVLRCGARMRDAPEHVVETARANGVSHTVFGDGTLEIPGEWVTDPVAFTLALAAAAERHGAEIRRGERFEHRAQLAADLYVNCAGLGADEVARVFGDDTFSIFPRKGEFFVFDADVSSILLPAPTARTKGVLVFPTIDGHLVCGPTAVDGEDKTDWSVRPQARDEVLAGAIAMCPALEGARQVGQYAGLRPAGRGVNYVVGRSTVAPELVNVAAIRSTGLTASLGLAEHVAGLIAPGVPEAPLLAGDPPPRPGEPWWRRAAEHRA
jgi:glycerol-3-phosphate dehydrogenase